MTYWTFDEEFLSYIRSKWIEYYKQRIDAINFIYNFACDSCEREANIDFNTGIQDFDSVQKWYDDKIVELRKWYDTAIGNLKEENKLFIKLYSVMISEKFDMNDFHYLIVYDFNTFTKTRKYNHKGSKDNFHVDLIGTSYWYECGKERKECGFIPMRPTYLVHNV
jgi:hypothetical protein